jgi:hypothetical protein
MLAVSVITPSRIIASDHRLEPCLADPPLAHVLLLGLPPHRPGREVGGQEDVDALAAHAVGDVQPGQMADAPGARAGLLGQLGAGQLQRVAVGAVGEGALPNSQ